MKSNDIHTYVCSACITGKGWIEFEFQFQEILDELPKEHAARISTESLKACLGIHSMKPHAWISNRKSNEQ